MPDVSIDIDPQSDIALLLNVRLPVADCLMGGITTFRLKELVNCSQCSS
jgi:hypothetical protein